MAKKGYPIFPKSPRVTIICFNVIFKTLVVGKLPLCKDVMSVFYFRNRLGYKRNLFFCFFYLYLDVCSDILFRSLFISGKLIMVIFSIKGKTVVL